MCSHSVVMVCQWTYHVLWGQLCRNPKSEQLWCLPAFLPQILVPSSFSSPNPSISRCLPGSLWPADWDREPVHEQGRRAELAGAPQHPALSIQPDQVRHPALPGILLPLGSCSAITASHISFFHFLRFGLLPLSMSSSRKSKSTARSTERVQVGV